MIIIFKKFIWFPTKISLCDFNNRHCWQCSCLDWLCIFLEKLSFGSFIDCEFNTHRKDCLRCDVGDVNWWHFCWHISDMTSVTNILTCQVFTITFSNSLNSHAKDLIYVLLIPIKIRELESPNDFEFSKPICYCYTSLRVYYY